MQDSTTNMIMDAETASCVDVNSTLAAMLRQETAYVAPDYLCQNDLPESDSNGPLHHNNDDNEEARTTLEQDRAKMVGWQYQVADFCRFDRETVAIATSYFDRFLGTKAAAESHTNTDLFQLAAMTCFYTAAKIHEPESFEPWMLSKMSRGLYSPEQVEKMEMVILQAIGWRTNPPTALSFVRELLDILPECYLSKEMKPAVFDLCKFQTELCVRIYQFVPMKASTIAMAALMNAFESIGMDYSTLGFVEAHIAYTLKESSITLEPREDVQDRLYLAVTEFSGTHTEVSNSTSHPAKQTLCGDKRSAYNTSPVAVIYTTAA